MAGRAGCAEEIAMTTVAIVYHSGYGHTAVVAEHVAAGVTGAGAEARLLRITGADQDMEPILAALADADAVIFGAPTYMGGASAPFKVFADASSKAWFTLAWKDKLAAGFTNSLSLSGDKLSTLSYFSVLAAQHGMIWVSTGLKPGAALGDVSVDGVNRVGSSLGLMTQSDNAGPDVTPGAGDKKTAELFGARIAEVAKRWGRGAA
jgi:NAD(P)H dehydrogenase (quinone)